MSIVAGLIIYLLAALAPALLPIGVFNTVVLAAMPTIFLVIKEKVRIFDYSFGLFLGSILFVLFKFQSWEALAPMISFIQIVSLSCLTIIAIATRLALLTFKLRAN